MTQTSFSKKSNKANRTWMKQELDRDLHTCASCLVDIVWSHGPRVQPHFSGFSSGDTSAYICPSKKSILAKCSLS